MGQSIAFVIKSQHFFLNVIKDIDLALISVRSAQLLLAATSITY